MILYYFPIFLVKFRPNLFTLRKDFFLEEIGYFLSSMNEFVWICSFERFFDNEAKKKNRKMKTHNSSVIKYDSFSRYGIGGSKLVMYKSEKTNRLKCLSRNESHVCYSVVVLLGSHFENQRSYPLWFLLAFQNLEVN